MAEWGVVPVRGVSIDTTQVLAEALNEVERAGWSVSDVVAVMGGLAIVAYREFEKEAARGMTPRQRMKAAGIPRC